jgi:hypothetical protein
MDTNFQMLKSLLDKYHPAQRGIMNYDEKLLIQEMLHIGEMDILQLRNLRDFTVLYLGQSEQMKDLDIMSAITYCIDSAIIELGGEI